MHPADVRAEVEAIAREMQAFVHETAARMDEELLAALATTRIQINRVDPERFREASQPIYQEFAANVDGGQTLIDKALGAGS